MRIKRFNESNNTTSEYKFVEDVLTELIDEFIVKIRNK
jgi:hypothetical protein